jgi:hypothetical protein
VTRRVRRKHWTAHSHLPASARWTVSNTARALNRWHHVTVTFDGWMRHLNMYLDGALDRLDVFLGITPQAGGTFAAGKSSWHNGYYLARDIDELRLTPRVLSVAQVQSDFLSFPAI